MIINYKKLKSLQVETKSGMKIGKIHDVEIDIDTNGIVKYLITEGLFTTDLIVSPEQVISITEKKVVVEDNISSEDVTIEAESKLNPKIVSPAIEKTQD